MLNPIAATKKYIRRGLKIIHLHGAEPPENEGVARFNIVLRFTNKAESFSFPVAVKSIEELEKLLNFSKEGIGKQLDYCDKTFTIEALTFHALGLTEEARATFNKKLLNYISQSFTLTELKLTPYIDADEILDKKTKATIDALLERNRQFRIRNLKIAFLSPCLAILIGTAYAAAWPAFVTSAVLTCLLYQFYDKKLQAKKNPSLRLRHELAIIMLICTPFVFIPFLDFVGLGVSLGVGVAGLLVNYLRDNTIKNALTTYSVPTMKLSPDEINSIKNGFASQKKFTPAYWGASTWKCPKAYYVGHYTPEALLEEKIKANVKIS
ncbi:MAG: hypothetical protein JSS07_11300 [Proteobacteria bacterium]|nr:hypothetical protein [Pseudomonadota bacterium]